MHLWRSAVCVYIYMKSSFPKRFKRQSKNRCCMPMPKSEIMFWKKKSSWIVYVHTWKALCQNAIYEPCIGIATSFSGMALSAFWKRALHVYRAYILYVYICIYIYIFLYYIYIYIYSPHLKALCLYMTIIMMPTNMPSVYC